MPSVLLQSLVLASGGIFSVGSITLVILLLISDRGWRNGLAYTLGYLSAYTLIGLGVVWLGYDAGAPPSADPGPTASLLFILLGLLLLFVTQRNARKPPADPDDSTPPRLFAIVDRATPPKTFAFGMLVSVINFKNLAIFLSAISVVQLSSLTLNEKFLSALLVALVFCLAVIIPVLIYTLFPQRAIETLTWIKRSLEFNSRPIGIWVPLVFGLIFLVRGIRGLL